MAQSRCNLLVAFWAKVVTNPCSPAWSDEGHVPHASPLLEQEGLLDMALCSGSDADGKRCWPKGPALVPW